MSSVTPMKSTYKYKAFIRDIIDKQGFLTSTPRPHSKETSTSPTQRKKHPYAWKVKIVNGDREADLKFPWEEQGFDAINDPITNFQGLQSLLQVPSIYSSDDGHSSEEDENPTLVDEIELIMNRRFRDEAPQDEDFKEDVKESSFVDKMKSAMFKSDWSLVLEAVKQKKQKKDIKKEEDVDQVCFSMDKLLIKDKGDSQRKELNEKNPHEKVDTTSNKAIQETHNLRPRRKMLSELIKEGPFHCLLCRKHFTAKSSLNRHMKTHNEDENSRRPHLCECGKTFSRQDNLKSHQKAVHQRQRDFKCSECERQFGAKTNMLRHLKTVHVKK